MLIVHHLLDTLASKSKVKLDIKEGCAPDYLDRLHDQISLAQKFEFVAIPMEETATGFTTPAITDPEFEAWQRGLLPLPYPLVWYEFTAGGTRSCFLVEEEGGTRWVLERFDWLPSIHLVLADIQTVIDRAAPALNIAELSIRHTGNKTLYDRIPEPRRSFLFNPNDASFIIYLTLMLNSRTTERIPASAPPKLNRARIKRGVTPLADHRVVRIVPDRFIQTSAALGGHHASPRLHWRRSHIRTLHRGTKQEFVTLIPRVLVGRADLGEVSHEYRVG
jgi:hypothetical protein